MSLRMTHETFRNLIGQQFSGKVSTPRSTEEADFQRHLIKLAKSNGWLAYHAFDSRRSEPGWPDIALAKAGRNLILAELKSRRGRLSTPQRAWLETLGQSTGLEVHLWRPDDWAEIVDLLKSALCQVLGQTNTHNLKELELT